MTPTRTVTPGVAVGPIRSRRTFADLRRPSGRGRHGPVSVSFVDRPDWDRHEVAYAVNRKVGGAVTRNLLRRRMRAIVADRAPGLPTGAADRVLGSERYTVPVDGACGIRLEPTARLGLACTSNAQSPVTGPLPIGTPVRGSGRGRKWMDEADLSAQPVSYTHLTLPTNREV